MENQINFYGYARVSTQHQNLERQIQALQEYGITKENLFIDKKSGKDFNREDYQLLKQILKRTQNNVLVIKSIDRLGRNYGEIKQEWRRDNHRTKNRYSCFRYAYPRYKEIQGHNGKFH